MKPGGHGAQQPNFTGTVQLPNQVSLYTDQQHSSKGVTLVYLPPPKMLSLGLINSLEEAEFSYEIILA